MKRARLMKRLCGNDTSFTSAATLDFAQAHDKSVLRFQFAASNRVAVYGGLE